MCVFLAVYVFDRPAYPMVISNCEFHDNVLVVRSRAALRSHDVHVRKTNGSSSYSIPDLDL